MATFNDFVKFLSMTDSYFCLLRLLKEDNQNMKVLLFIMMEKKCEDECTPKQPVAESPKFNLASVKTPKLQNSQNS
jgi:hypothetical protein